MRPDVAPVRHGSRAAVGFSVHSGWAALVALTLTERQPVVLAKTRSQLVASFTYKFRQPYHTAAKMPPDQAGSFVSGIEQEAKGLAQKTIQSVQHDLQKKGYDLKNFALVLASGKPLPTLDRILASHALIHTADGELFRGALACAAEACHLEGFSVKQKELVDTGCSTLGLTSAALATQLAAIGKPLGAPWSQDEKFAALAAWLALSKAG